MDWPAETEPIRVPICDYCQQPAEHQTGAEAYPHRHDLHDLNFWVCKPCDARVGCHKGTLNPLGRFANSELRRAKMRAHHAFDRLWKNNGPMRRRQAYAWLASQLGIPGHECHIGMFDVDMCKKVVEVCNGYS
jgi:hypothetical protein